MTALTFLINEIREMADQGGWVFWALIVLAFGIAFALISIAHFLRLPNSPRMSGKRWLRLLCQGESDDDDGRAVENLLAVANEMPLIEQQLFARVERRIRFAFVRLWWAC